MNQDDLQGEAINLGVPGFAAFLSIEPWLVGVTPSQWKGDTGGLSLALGVG